MGDNLFFGQQVHLRGDLLILIRIWHKSAHTGRDKLYPNLKAIDISMWESELLKRR
jgi:hypothetical protein